VADDNIHGLRSLTCRLGQPRVSHTFPAKSFQEDFFHIADLSCIGHTTRPLSAVADEKQQLNKASLNSHTPIEIVSAMTNAFENAWNTLLLHLHRVIMWRLGKIELNLVEPKTLAAEHVENRLMQKLLVWRRSNMYVALPSLLFSAIFGLVSLKDLEFSVFNGLGKLVLLMPVLSPSVSFISICLGVYWWGNHNMSTRCVSYGWTTSLIMPLWPALLPIDYLIKSEFKQNIDASIRIYLGIAYSLQLLPLIVTVPAGLVKASLRIRGLLPESSLAGWFIVMVSPITPLMIFAAIVLLTQSFGDAILLVGTILLMVSPLLYVMRRKLYTDVLTPEQDLQLDWNQRFISLLSILGIILITIWAIVNKIFPNASNTCLFLFQWFGRTLTTTITFADTVFRVTVHQLKQDRKRHEEGHYAEVDALLQSLQGNQDKKQHKDVTGIMDTTEEDQASAKDSSKPNLIEMSDVELGNEKEAATLDEEVSSSIQTSRNGDKRSRHASSKRSSTKSAPDDGLQPIMAPNSHEDYDG
jgi:hypothetical protein